MFIIIGFLWMIFAGTPIIAGRIAHLNALEDELYKKAMLEKEINADVRIYA